jgi:hypothetical protein
LGSRNRIPKIGCYLNTDRSIILPLLFTSSQVTTHTVGEIPADLFLVFLGGHPPPIDPIWKFDPPEIQSYPFIGPITWYWSWN